MKSRHSRRTVPTSRSQYAFAFGARTGVRKTFQFKITLQFLVQLTREDRIAVVDQEPITVVTRDGFSELLRRPGDGRMRRRVVMEDTTAAYLYHEENIKHPEIGPSRNEEVAGDDPSNMVLDERSPALRRGSVAPSLLHTQGCAPQKPLQVAICMTSVGHCAVKAQRSTSAAKRESVRNLSHFGSTLRSARCTS